jgi:hypothetical protein
MYMNLSYPLRASPGVINLPLEEQVKTHSQLVGSW